MCETHNVYHCADMIRPLLKEYTQPISTILEIPSNIRRSICIPTPETAQSCGQSVTLEGFK